MKTPILSPKKSKSINKKINFAEQIKPVLVKNQAIPIKIQVPKSPKRSQYTPERKRYMTQISSTKNSDLTNELQRSEKDLNARNEKLCACINLFNLMQSNNMQLRCFQHNNIYTLYCLTQRKVLCVNCNYGDYRHKTHKILPLKDSTAHINQDNALLKEMITRDLKAIEQSIKNCQQNTVMLENEMRNSVGALEKQYAQKIDQLKLKYEQQIQKTKNNFSVMIKKSKNLERGIEQFKFKIWQTISKIGIENRKEVLSNQAEITKQVLCSNMAEFTKIQVRKLNRKDIDRLHLKTKFS